MRVKDYLKYEDGSFIKQSEIEKICDCVCNHANEVCDSYNSFDDYHIVYTISWVDDDGLDMLNFYIDLTEEN